MDLEDSMSETAALTTSITRSKKDLTNSSKISVAKATKTTDLKI